MKSMSCFRPLALVATFALAALSLALTGCDSTPAEQLRKAGKVAALGGLAKDPEAHASFERIANQLDEVIAGEALIDDALIEMLAVRLVVEGQIDLEEAVLVVAAAQELWPEFRPKEGILKLDNPKVVAAVHGFTDGIREGVATHRRLQALIAAAQRGN